MAIGEIGSILKARVVDSNKAVQALALDIVSRIASGMGKPFEKHLRLLLVPVAAVLSDQKANVRTLALNALTAMATACEGVDAMAVGLGSALETQNPVQRSSILNWAVEWFKNHESLDADLSSWTATVLSCLDDRNSDVRKGAQAILPILIGSVGFDEVIRQTNSLKPASRSTVVPLVQAARASAPAQSIPPPKPPTASAPTKAPAKSTPKATPPPSDLGSPPKQSASLPGPNVTGVRKPLPGTGAIPRPQSRLDGEGGGSGLQNKIGGLRRPGATSSASTKSPSTPASATFGASAVLTTANFEAKKARLSKDAGRWINEGGTTRKDLAELLQHQLEPHASKGLVSLLFSHDHNAVNDHVAGMTKLIDLYSSVRAGEDTYGSPNDLQNVCVANSDLALKYASIKAHEPQSNVIAKVLELVDAVISLLHNVNFQLTDAEAQCFIPTIVHKVSDLSTLGILVLSFNCKARRPERTCPQQSTGDHPVNCQGVCI
jgi:cytoskeleton-associated protein 5